MTILREADFTAVAGAAKRQGQRGRDLRLRKHLGQLEVADVKRLKTLEMENSQLTCWSDVIRTPKCDAKKEW